MYARDQAIVATPIGKILILGDENQLYRIRLGAEGDVSRGTALMVRAAAEQFDAWFAGARQVFDLTLDLPATARGAELRRGLIAVGYGDTMSYGALARRLNSGPRAIGQLCARNPYPIVVPCHRIVGAGGALGSYSAGEGLKTKSWLLDFERAHQTG